MFRLTPPVVFCALLLFPTILQGQQKGGTFKAAIQPQTLPVRYTLYKGKADHGTYRRSTRGSVKNTLEGLVVMMEARKFFPDRNLLLEFELSTSKPREPSSYHSSRRGMADARTPTNAYLRGVWFWNRADTLALSVKFQTGGTADGTSRGALFDLTLEGTKKLHKQHQIRGEAKLPFPTQQSCAPSCWPYRVTPALGYTYTGSGQSPLQIDGDMVFARDEKRWYYAGVKAIEVQLSGIPYLSKEIVLKGSVANDLCEEYVLPPDPKTISFACEGAWVPNRGSAPSQESGFDLGRGIYIKKLFLACRQHDYIHTYYDTSIEYSEDERPSTTTKQVKFYGLSLGLTLSWVYESFLKITIRPACSINFGKIPTWKTVDVTLQYQVEIEVFVDQEKPTQ